MRGSMNGLRKGINSSLLCLLMVGNVFAVIVVRKNIDQSCFKGPCGCIALICAGRLSGNEKKVSQLITVARKSKKNLISTEILSIIANQAGLNLYCLTLNKKQPMILGEVTWIELFETQEKARISKTKKTLELFKYATNKRFIFFICHIICDRVDHCFLIAIDKHKNILYYYTDQVTRYNMADVRVYTKELASWYESA